MYDIIIDGGTTNLRVFLLSIEGEIICSEKAEGGVKYTAIDGNNSRLRSMLKNCIESVLQRTNTQITEIRRCVAFGMITSGLGLLEIPHIAAPASAADLRNGMKNAGFDEILPIEIEFIPGVRNFNGEINAANVSQMDMMRGEETETVGLVSLLKPSGAAVLILPGSHNKLINISADGKILGCKTSISGELLDAVTHHTILSGAVEGSFCTSEEYDCSYAIAGAKETIRNGLGRAAFAGRILSVTGGCPAGKVRSWLLGATLAQDVQTLNGFTAGNKETEICIAGKDPVKSALSDIFNEEGYKNITAVPEEISSQMGIAGARLIAGL